MNNLIKIGLGLLVTTIVVLATLSVKQGKIEFLIIVAMVVIATIFYLFTENFFKNEPI